MNRKTRISSGMAFGLIMAAFYIVQNLWLSDQLTPFRVFISVIAGVVGGVVAGFLYGWLIGLMANSTLFTKGTKLEPDADETILFQTNANHFKGLEGVGGKLYLTSKRLIFISHRFNFQNHRLSVNLSEITDAYRHKTAGIIKNGLSVSTTENVTEKFVVEQPEEWLTQLEARKTVWQKVQ